MNMGIKCTNFYAKFLTILTMKHRAERWILLIFYGIVCVAEKARLPVDSYTTSEVICRI